MKRILLLGDSIRLSYRARVQELLAGKAEIVGPDDNCRFSAYTLFNAETWLGEGDYDVIQWNNGQWDTCHLPDGRIFVSIDSYVEQQRRVAAILRPRAGRLVFASTTPVSGDMFAAKRPRPRGNRDIAAYNQAAANALRPLGVEILDLYTPVLAAAESCIGEDFVHLTPTGVELCAGLVSAHLARR